MVCSVFPHPTILPGKISPIIISPLGIDPSKMLRIQTYRIAWYVLEHTELHLHTVAVVHFHNVKPYDSSLHSPNLYIIFIGYMVQTQVWSPCKLLIKKCKLMINFKIIYVKVKISWS